VTYGFYADPVDEGTAVLPKGWKGRLVNLPAGDTGGVRGLCLEPHDLAISKYVASRDKDRIFTQELARRGLVDREKLLALVGQTPKSAVVRSESERTSRATLLLPTRSRVASPTASDPTLADQVRPSLCATRRHLDRRHDGRLVGVRVHLRQWARSGTGGAQEVCGKAPARVLPIVCRQPPLAIRFDR
jgi:hypothetical protein